MASSIPSYFQAKQDDDQRHRIVQQIVQKCTDVLRRTIVPVEGQGGVTQSYVCRHCQRYPLEDYILLGLDGAREKQCNWWVRGGSQYD